MVSRFIRNFARIGGAVATLLLSACAGPGTVALSAGETESAVVARIGPPTHVFVSADGNGRILEYMTGPFGQTTHLARIGPDGRLISYEQVLNSATFAKIKPDIANKADVIQLIGTPSETTYLPLPKLEVWSYPYKENPVSDSMMHVHFDKAGIVRKMMNGPDPNRDPDRRAGAGFGFGFRRD